MFKIFIIIFLVALDISSKQIIFNYIDLNRFVEVTPFLDLAHIHNYGIAFGFFEGILPSWFFILIAFLVTLLIFYMFVKSSNYIEKWAYLFIISGALSNIIDRVINGYVIDFIYMHYKEFNWYTFNFADIYISLGVFILILQVFYDFKKRIFK